MASALGYLWLIELGNTGIGFWVLTISTLPILDSQVGIFTIIFTSFCPNLSQGIGVGQIFFID
jgi:hypothetical protein